MSRDDKEKLKCVGWAYLPDKNNQGVYYMKINAVNNQPAFQKVNQKYLKEAENWYKRIGDIDSSWYESLRDDVTLFKDISSKDGVDTMNAARNYVRESSKKFFNHVMDCIKRA